MLRVDRRDLSRGPVRTDGELEPDDPAFKDLGLDLVGPVRVKGQAQATADGEYLWRGSLQGMFRSSCRRCLTEVITELDVDVPAAMFSTDPDAADDPESYPLAERAPAVDIAEVVREELALASTQANLALCREDCAGLCPRCGADLNAGPCECRAPAEPV